MSDLVALDFFSRFLAVLTMGRTSDMFHIIAFCKMLKLKGIERWFIVAH